MAQDGNKLNSNNAPLSCEEAFQVVKNAFLSGAEREISIGDGVHIVIMQKGKLEPRMESFALPRH